MSMTLEQIEAKLKEAERHNTQLATRKAMYVERLQKEFGVTTVEELKKMLKENEDALAAKTKEYQEVLATAETMLKEAGIECL